LLALLAAGTVARAEDTETVTARFADGTSVVAVLQSISSREIRLKGQAAPIATADVIRLDFLDRHRVPAPRASLIQLINGDRVVAGLIPTGLPCEFRLKQLRAF
jgi:hypothetical protein